MGYHILHGALRDLQTVNSSPAYNVTAPSWLSRDPKAYLSVIRHLSLPPEKCAMVAAHLYDLRAAASLGLKTVYIRRAEEDGDSTDAVRSKRDGGEVDVVVDSFLELAKIVRASSVRL